MTESEQNAREALLAFYEKHAPAKKSLVDMLLAVFRGREQRLLQLLKQKYKGTARSRQQIPNYKDPEFGIYPTIQHGLTHLFKKCVLPLELKYHYQEFAEPLTVEDFDTKPIIVIIGKDTITLLVSGSTIH